MNSVFIALISIAVFVFGWRFYRAKLSRIWEIDPKNPTPAHTKFNGVDFVPSKNWLFLFGHHFSSIAGAGPILGPVLACVAWGWFPAFLWVVLGSVFIGGIHDFSALIISVRNGGDSIADVSEKVVGRNARIFFSVFIFLALVLVVAVFAIVTAKTLIETPKIVIPTFGMIFVAVGVGLMIYKWKVNSLFSTVAGLALIVALIVAGDKYPLVLHAKNPLSVWILILLLYAGIASVLPVNILLQPRDYLSAFFLFAGLIFGYAGIFVSHPTMVAPAFVSFSSARGFLWPTMFIIIACGATSGFHSLVASGTTSKQISNERYAFRIGYGAMIAEGVLSVLAIIAVAAALSWKGPGSYPELMKSGNWIGTFAAGFGALTKPIFGSFGIFFAMLILNAFVMTTLDTATRITRYIGVELFGKALGVKFLKNNVLMTVIIVIFAYWLSTGPQARIWPIFGASNQLIAALVLLVTTAYLFSKNKPTLFVLIPGIFMLVTTIAALGVEMAKNFGRSWLLFGIAVVLMIMAVFVLIEAINHAAKIRRSRIFNAKGFHPFGTPGKK
ncbi:MAG: carbon starvation protein A [Elusimicrobia bacterium]|nr:carbon starvation protein A [Elusimicrobiota bacterium]